MRLKHQTLLTADLDSELFLSLDDRQPQRLCRPECTGQPTEPAEVAPSRTELAALDIPPESLKSGGQGGAEERVLIGHHLPGNLTMPNMQKQEPCRKKILAGDVFAMKLHDDLFLHGLVAKTNVRSTIYRPEDSEKSDKFLLLHIFKEYSQSKRNPVSLLPSDMLIPPVITNSIGFRRGFFEVVGHVDVKPEHLLPRYCFRRRFGPTYFDEYGYECGFSEPCGDAGLESYLTIDDRISEALELPLAPD